MQLVRQQHRFAISRPPYGRCRRVIAVLRWPSFGSRAMFDLLMIALLVLAVAGPAAYAGLCRRI
jgi:hypothetical protein